MKSLFYLMKSLSLRSSSPSLPLFRPPSFAFSLSLSPALTEPRQTRHVLSPVLQAGPVNGLLCQLVWRPRHSRWRPRPREGPQPLLAAPCQRVLLRLQAWHQAEDQSRCEET
jgi:hypothetical protein